MYEEDGPMGDRHVRPVEVAYAWGSGGMRRDKVHGPKWEDSEEGRSWLTVESEAHDEEKEGCCCVDEADDLVWSVQR